MINPLHQPQQVFLLEKVLGFDQAKRRLQAFAKSKAANSFKGKSSAIFAEDDDDYPVRDNSDNQSPMVKNSTHIIASIMKEETESREPIKKNIEKLARNTEEVQSDIMKDSNYKSSKDDHGEDLRNVLRRKREVAQESSRRNRSNSRERRSRSGSRKIRNRNRKKSNSCSKERKRKESHSPDKTKGRQLKNRRSSGSKKRKGSKDRSMSRDKKFKNRKDSPSLSPRIEKDSSTHRGSSKLVSKGNRSFASDRSSSNKRREISHEKVKSRERRSSQETKDTHTQFKGKYEDSDLQDRRRMEEYTGQDGDSNSCTKKLSYSYEKTSRRQRQNSNSMERYDNSSNNRKLEVDKAQHGNTKKDIDLWELHQGNKSIKKSSEDLSDRFNKDLSNQNVPLHQSQSVLIKTTSDTDYYEIKQEHQDVSSFLV